MSTLYRSTVHEFRTEFLDPLGVAAEPANPNQPQVTILDPDGRVVDTGVARRRGQTQVWTYSWGVPEAAPLGSDWIILWVMATPIGDSIERQANFAVSEPRVSTGPEDDSEPEILELGDSTVLRLVSPVELHTVTVKLVHGNQTVQEWAPGAVESTRAGADIVYHVTTPALLTAGRYRATWSIRESEVSRTDRIRRFIDIPEARWFDFLPDLRAFLDKLGARARASQQDWTEAELYAATRNGLDWINSVPPMTSMQISQVIQSSIRVYVLVATAMFALRSRQILNIDLHFVLSNLKATIEHDAGSQLDSIAGSLLDLLREEVPKIKKFQHSRSRPRSGMSLRLQPGRRRRYGRIPLRVGGLQEPGRLAESVVNLGLEVDAIW